MARSIKPVDLLRYPQDRGRAADEWMDYMRRNPEDAEGHDCELSCMDQMDCGNS
jgi:hypothetical protein